jgi:catechol 2,3-dioxygenase-like lactoylglutathione lyase family enzyme
MCKKNEILTTDNTPTSTLGIHHLGLTVPDITETAAFFTEHLGFQQVGGQPDYPSIFISNDSIMLTLWQVKDSENTTPFNRQTNIGLHHFALKVASVDMLHNVYQRLSQLDNVEIEFAPEPLTGLPLYHMMCFIPGGIRLELISE